MHDAFIRVNQIVEDSENYGNIAAVKSAKSRATGLIGTFLELFGRGINTLLSDISEQRQISPSNFSKSG